MGPRGAARRGRGVGAEAGRGAERGGAELARGARRAGASQVGCCWLSPRLRLRWPEPDARRLRAAPALFLPGSAPTRPRRRGRPRGALLENSGVSASELLGRKPSAPGEAGVPERPRNACSQLAPFGNRDRRAFSSACNAGRAGRVESTTWEGATRTPMMDAQTWRAGCCCLLLLALVGSTRSEGVQSCEEVRKLFQWRLVGAVKGLPDSPRAGEARRADAGRCAATWAGGVLSADSALPGLWGWRFVGR